MSDRYSVKLISKNGDFLPLLHRMKKSGHDVLAYVEGNLKLYDNILPKVHDINELDIAEGDVVVFDMVGAGKGADLLKEKGIAVVGGGELNDKLELDREFGMRFMEQHGIQIPPSIYCDTFDEAREVVQKTQKRYVLKPDGNLTTDLTYVSEDADDMLRMMDYFEDKIPDGTSFVLQEFVEGVEMSTEAWFNGERFLLPINSTFEEKKFMNGGYGPNTGCSGNVVWFWDEEISEKLYRMLFEKMEEPLREAGYVGPLDINAIWTEQGPLGLEFTARFGYDAIQCASRLIDMELGEFLHDLPALSEVPVKAAEYAMSVRCSIPPYPNDGEVPEIPIDVSGCPPDALYLSDVYNKDGTLVCGGEDGYICAVAGHGNRLNTVAKGVYEKVDTLIIPGLQIRTDINDRVAADREKVTQIINNTPLDRYGK